MSRPAALLVALALPVQAWAVPTLYIRPAGNAVPGDIVTLRISGLTPGETVTLAAGPSGGLTCPAALNFCLDLARPRRVGAAVADAVGSAEITVALPDTLPVGGSVAFQAVQIADGQVSPAVTVALSDRVALFGVWDDLSGVYGQIEVDNQGTVDDIHTTRLADFDNAAQQGFADWLRPNGWYYWERLSWTSYQGQDYLCWSMPSPAEATVRRLGPIDASDPTTQGCLGGPWTPLAPAAPEVAGAWHDPAGRVVQIDAQAVRWGNASGAVSRFSNRERVLISQNAAAAPSPGRWSRTDWTVDAAGGVWLCATTRSAASEWDARSTPAADPGDLANGCQRRAWTAIAP